MAFPTQRLATYGRKDGRLAAHSAAGSSLALATPKAETHNVFPEIH